LHVIHCLPSTCSSLASCFDGALGAGSSPGLLFGTLCLLSACSSRDALGARDTVGPPGVLSPLTNLAPLELVADPLAAHRPETADCSGLTGWYFEGESLEVNTGSCNYLALSEPAAVAAPAGASVTTEVRHFDLTAPEPARAHLALLVRETVLWETTIDIPGKADVFEISVTLPEPVSRGDVLTVHLHNHGQNTYAFSPWLVSETVVEE
jgi:hypothetical protein